MKFLMSMILAFGVLSSCTIHVHHHKENRLGDCAGKQCEISSRKSKSACEDCKDAGECKTCDTIETKKGSCHSGYCPLKQKDRSTSSCCKA